MASQPDVTSTARSIMRTHLWVVVLLGALNIISIVWRL